MVECIYPGFYKHPIYSKYAINDKRQIIDIENTSKPVDYKYLDNGHKQGCKKFRRFHYYILYPDCVGNIIYYSSDKFFYETFNKKVIGMDEKTINNSRRFDCKLEDIEIVPYSFEYCDCKRIIIHDVKQIQYITIDNNKKSESCVNQL